MSTHFLFVENKNNSMDYLCDSALQHEIAVQRMPHGMSPAAAVRADIPEAVVVDQDVHDVQSFIEELRLDQRLSTTPIILCVSEPDPALLSNAFAWGIDDYLVRRDTRKFPLIAAALQSRDSWHLVRAPLGQIILAHEDRLERVKLSNILKRIGFDTIFCSSFDEIFSILNETPVRAVISSSYLLGSRIDVLWMQLDEEGALPPMIVLSTEKDFETIRSRIPPSMTVKNFNPGDDAEGIVYVINELIVPKGVQQRRSERLLYGSPVAMIHRAENVTIDGFTFNINLGGMYIRTLAPLPVQTKIEVSFRPPLGRGQIVADAQVVWSRRFAETHVASPPGMGIQFLDMWEADRSAYETGYRALLDESRQRSFIPCSPAEMQDSGASLNAGFQAYCDPEEVDEIIDRP